jgi:hypothetical protein
MEKLNKYINKQLESPHTGIYFGIVGGSASADGWTTEWDFSVDPSWNFNTGSSTNKVDTSTEKLYIYTQSTNHGGTNYASYADIDGGATLDDTAFVCKIFKYNRSTISTYGIDGLMITAGNNLTPAYKSDGWFGGASHDTILWHTYVTASQQPVNRRGYTFGANTGTTDSDNLAILTGTDYYYQLIRESSTVGNKIISTNEDMSSPLADDDFTLDSAIGGLRSIKFGNLVYTGFGTGVQQGTIDEIKFADGVTVPP